MRISLKITIFVYDNQEGIITSTHTGIPHRTKQIFMKRTTVYITVRLDVEFDQKKFASEQEAAQYAVQETPYCFTLEKPEIKIADTEICGINDNPEF